MKELRRFLREQKRYWLLPPLIVTCVFVVLVVLRENGALPGPLLH